MATDTRMDGAGVNKAGRSRRVRRSALLLALIAAAFYLGFILMSVVRGLR